MTEKSGGKREQKKELTRQKIISAAAYEFAQKGVKNTSVSDIMEKAGLGLGTFYNYFADKDDILLTMLATPVRTTAQQIKELKEKKAAAAEILAVVSATVAAFIDEHRFVLQLFQASADNFAVSGRDEHAPSEGMPSVAEKVRGKAPGFKNLFEAIIREGQAGGEIRSDIPAEVMSEMFHAIYQAAALSKLNLPYTENVALKIAVLLDGMQSADGE